MNRYSIINESFVKHENAKIHISDLSIQRGYGIFEYYHAYNNIPFLQEEYLDRLFRSAELINLNIGYNKQTIADLIKTLIERNKLGNSNVKIIVTGGYSKDGYVPSKSNLIITNSSINTIATDFHINGCCLLVEKYRREFPQAKTINYIQSVRLIDKMRTFKAVDVLYYDDISIREASRCNIFVIKNGEIYTPSSEILEGVTRKFLINILSKNGINIFFKNITLSELYDSDEIFITSTSKRVMPVVKIETRKINGGLVGNFTKEITNLINNAINEG